MKKTSKKVPKKISPNSSVVHGIFFLVTTYETIHFSPNQMILEAQYIPENEDCEAGEEYPHYESVYIQSADSSEQIEEGVVHTEERNSESNEEYNHSNDAEFQVVEGIHVTG